MKLLVRLRILTDADGIVLANLCQAWSTLVKAQVKINETGLLLKTPSGYVHHSQLLGIVNNCTETVVKHIAGVWAYAVVENSIGGAA